MSLLAGREKVCGGALGETGCRISGTRACERTCFQRVRVAYSRLVWRTANDAAMTDLAVPTSAAPGGPGETANRRIGTALVPGDRTTGCRHPCGACGPVGNICGAGSGGMRPPSWSRRRPTRRIDSPRWSSPARMFRESSSGATGRIESRRGLPPEWLPIRHDLKLNVNFVCCLPYLYRLIGRGSCGKRTTIGQRQAGREKSSANTGCPSPPVRAREKVT